ncbi:MAG: polysaccharide deacetylase family protein [Rhizobiaceae bacterium]
MAGRFAYSMILNALYFSGAQATMRYWLGGRGAILMLHRVGDGSEQPGFDPNAHLRVSAPFLDRLLGKMKKRGYQFVSLDEVAARLKSPAGPNDDRFVSVTLDDGYRDNLENAVPVFRRHGVPYTIYVAPGLVDGKASLWWEDLAMAIASRDHFVLRSRHGNVDFDVSNVERKNRVFGELLTMLTTDVSEDEQRRLVGELCAQCSTDPQAHRAASIMNWREIGELARDPLCTIGAHTVAHYALARLEHGRALNEIEQSASIIAMETGATPRHFAYPYGYKAAAGPREFAMTRDAGFETAVTTRHGVLYQPHGDHLHALPRISLNGLFQKKRYVDTLLSGLPTLLQNRGRRLNIS